MQTDAQIVTFVTPIRLARLPPGVAFCAFPAPEPGALALLFLPKISLARLSCFFFWRPGNRMRVSVGFVGDQE